MTTPAYTAGNVLGPLNPESAHFPLVSSALAAGTGRVGRGTCSHDLAGTVPLGSGSARRNARAMAAVAGSGFGTAGDRLFGGPHRPACNPRPIFPPATGTGQVTNARRPALSTSEASGDLLLSS